jgi:hypothetical protein
MLMSQRSQSDLQGRIARLDSVLIRKVTERARVINLVRRGLISDAEAEHELKRLQLEVSQMQQEREELLRGQETAEELELRILNAETMLSLMADRAAKAVENTKREIVLALVDRVTIETSGQGKDARTTAKACYTFSPSPSVSPSLYSNLSPVVDYLTCA